ncbi:uncharacterized protein N7483_009090 [Penicillium malachiteum]|uniref:uncharacterized protein n=1 Tax=Penicillium malachiteum TaxID=1324776 RepID=UPI0025489012|nr:uncharacterized protein N7483_009090 [Penicillium malachiteum]KAJ5721156.1 hypothetical protein N7483_009090 [Penicillium malachiteum]
MSSSGVSSRKLHQLIEDEGFKSFLPCVRCTRLRHACIRSDRSKSCSCCVRAGRGIKCEMPERTFTDSEWRRLVRAQDEVAEKCREALAAVMRLDRQEALLKKYAGDFIARKYDEVAQLEELERREKEEIERLEKERVECRYWVR